MTPSGFESLFKTVRLLLLALLLKSATSDQARLRLDGGRIVTSSTLKWVTGTGGIPEHAILVTDDDVSTVWCRAKQHGTFVGGSFHEGVCTTPFLDQVLKVSEGYQILVSINGSARVKRFHWDRYKAPPVNAIASSAKQKQFLAFHAEEDSILKVGYLIPPERRVHMVDGETVKKSDEAVVLAEDEPIRYELTTISLDKKRKVVSKEEEVMQHTVLANEGTANQRMVESADISVKHLVYWGQVKGTLVGRKARILTPKPEEEEEEITWGVQNHFNSIYTQFLEYDLPPGTATNVKVIGTIRKTEAPYVGTLTALYSDDTQLSRVIEGLHMDERLLMLRAEYSPPYYIHNNTEIGEEGKTDVLYKSTTTTTTTTTTETTKMTTSSPEPPWVSMVRPEEPKTESLNHLNEREVRNQNSVNAGVQRELQNKLVPFSLLFLLLTLVTP